MEYRSIGFIGAGNMGGAIIRGILRAGIFTKENIMAADHSEAALRKQAEELGIRTTTDNRELVKSSDILLLSVKPSVLPAVIAEIADEVREDQLIISIAAGQSLERLEGLFGRKLPMIRVMPNTPALVGEGMAALSPNELVSEEASAFALKIFESFGQAEILPEKLQDVVVGVSGSSPAYVYMMIEAMADAAVADGMPRAQAYKFAAQAVLGSAKMVLETGQHPGALKDAVCSPGGTTIEAVALLEQLGFRSAVIEAQRACVAKSKEL